MRASTNPADSATRLVEWLERAADGGMPLDPLLWEEGPIRSTYPACMAVKAAAEQDLAADYLRSLREGLLCFRRKLDTSEALVEAGAAAPGLDVERFRIDLASHAIVEAFGATSRRRARFRTSCSRRSASATSSWVLGPQPYEAYREAALAAGARPSGAEPPACSRR